MKSSRPRTRISMSSSQSKLKLFVPDLLAARVKPLYDFGRSLAALRSSPLVALYQMGKVGSQAIEDALAREDKGPTIHFHFIAHLRRQKPWEARLLGICLSQELPLRVISPVREPVSRNLSAFAHDFRGSFSARMQDFETKHLQTISLQKYDRHRLGLDWFDTEFYKTLGIDAYARPFDTDRGFTRLSAGNVAVLVIQSELEDAAKEKILCDFLDLERLHLTRRNTADDRDYKGNYREFRDSVWLPSQYLDEMYSSRFARHFYSEEQLRHFRARWERKTRSLRTPDSQPAS